LFLLSGHQNDLKSERFNWIDELIENTELLKNSFFIRLMIDIEQDVILKKFISQTIKQRFTIFLRHRWRKWR